MRKVDDSQSTIGWEAARGLGFKKWCGWRGPAPKPILTPHRSERKAALYRGFVARSSELLRFMRCLPAVVKQGSYWNTKSGSKHLNRIKRWIRPASFDSRHVRTSEPAAICECLLAQARVKPKLFDALSESFSEGDVHPRDCLSPYTKRPRTNRNTVNRDVIQK